MLRRLSPLLVVVSMACGSTNTETDGGHHATGGGAGGGIVGGGQGGAGGGTTGKGGGQGGGTSSTGGGQGNVGGGAQGGGGGGGTGQGGGSQDGGQGNSDGGARVFDIEFKSSCPAIAPCGGNAEGTWAYTAACFSLSVDAGPSCPGVTYDFHGTASGTMEFTPSSVSQSVSWAVGGNVVVPYGCAHGLCSLVTTTIRGLGLPTTGCTGSGLNTPCTCPVSFDGGSVATSDAGASGTRFHLTDSSGVTSTYEYCIQNGSLNFHQVPTTTSTDSSAFTLGH